MVQRTLEHLYQLWAAI